MNIDETKLRRELERQRNLSNYLAVKRLCTTLLAMLDSGQFDRDLDDFDRHVFSD